MTDAWNATQTKQSRSKNLLRRATDELTEDAPPLPKSLNWSCDLGESIRQTQREREAVLAAKPRSATKQAPLCNNGRDETV